jgi:tRNA 2-thiouridine synthesizing protein E
MKEAAMPVIQLNSHDVHIDDEGFLTQYDEWDEDLAKSLAAQIGIELTDDHWKVIRFLRADYKAHGETPTTRRVQMVGGVPVKQQFALFPKKPAKKAAYIAGLPKPRGCV